MKFPDQPDARSFLNDLMSGYAPANAQERLMVHEVAATWTRLEECRERERLFFSLMRAKEGLSDKPGAEVTIWYKDSHKAYDQITRAIRDAEMAFHRAVQRAGTVIGNRLKLEQKSAKAKVVAMPPRIAHDEKPVQPPYIPRVRAANST